MNALVNASVNWTVDTGLSGLNVVQLTSCFFKASIMFGLVCLLNSDMANAMRSSVVALFMAN